jgi:hypothetical protein
MQTIDIFPKTLRFFTISFNQANDVYVKIFETAQLTMFYGKALELLCFFKAWINWSMLTANLKFRTQKIFLFSFFLQCFALQIRLRNDSYCRNKYLKAPCSENKHIH